MDVVMMIANALSMPMLAKLVYILVGLSTVYEIAIHKSVCRMCNPSGGTMT